MARLFEHFSSIPPDDGLPERMTAPKRYKLIANPTARRGDARSAISRVMTLFARAGVDHDLELTSGPKEAGMIAKAACEQYDVIVAVGGDGTINEVVQGMVFAKKPLGVIPCGSGNDFVKSLHIPPRVEEAVEILFRGETRTIDAGRINGKYFANGVGIGFDAAVTAASKGFRRIKGLPLYIAATLKALGTFQPVPLTVTLDNGTIRQDIFLLTTGNGTTCGGGFVLTPRAKVDDGLLDVTLVRPMSIPAVLRYLPDVFRGTIERVPYATMHTSKKIIVESSGRVPVHMDGELFEENTTRYELEVVPKALKVIGNF